MVYTTTPTNASGRTSRTSRGGVQSIHQGPLVTVTHKSNVLSQTDGLFRKTAMAVLAKEKYSAIRAEEQIVDSMVYKIFRQPSAYDVVVAPNSD